MGNLRQAPPVTCASVESVTDGVVALFPLGLVLMPAARLPVHVFERRYRRMLEDIAEDSKPGSFGVVALTRGWEVRSREFRDDTHVAEVGTMAEIVQMHRHPDGASDLFTVGSRRFRIRAFVHDAPYLRARVDYLDEPEGGLRPNHVAAVRELGERYLHVVAALNPRDADTDTRAEPLPDDPWLLSYRLGATLPLPPADRQALLELPSTAARLEREAALLRRELALLQRTRTVAVLPGVVQLAARPN